MHEPDTHFPRVDHPGSSRFPARFRCPAPEILKSADLSTLSPSQIVFLVSLTPDQRLRMKERPELRPMFLAWHLRGFDPILTAEARRLLSGHKIQHAKKGPGRTARAHKSQTGHHCGKHRIGNGRLNVR